jgi:putative ABC transport system permease protein
VDRTGSFRRGKVKIIRKQCYAKGESAFSRLLCTIPMILDLLKMVLIQMKKRPFRTGLTILQVTLGIAAVALVFNVIFGLLDGLNEAEDMGLSQVYMMRIEEDHMGPFIQNAYPIFKGDLFKDIMENVDTIEYISPFYCDYEPVVESDGVLYRVRCLAYVGPDFHKILGLKLMRGAFFTDEDYHQRARVCIISKVMANILYGDLDPLGKTIYTYRFWYSPEMPLPAPVEYTIIGIFDPGRYKREAYDMLDSQILVPASILSEDHMGPGQALIRIKPGGFGPTLAATSAITKDFYGGNMEVVLTGVDASMKYMAKTVMHLIGIMWGFSLIILIISSIGILSTMMVNTLERTGQIGVEKALGAYRGLIMLRLNLEAILISSMGGVLGIALARWLTKHVHGLLDILPFALEGGLHPKATLISLLLAVGAGWLFGLFPALQASRLPPSEILRQK